MRLPPHWLRHEVIVEPYLGEGGAGPLYGPPVRVRCHLAVSRRSQRSGSDRTQGDSTTCIALPAARDLLREDARITVDGHLARGVVQGGRVVEVLAVRERTYPGGSAPEHVELTFV